MHGCDLRHTPLFPARVRGALGFPAVPVGYHWPAWAFSF